MTNEDVVAALIAALERKDLATAVGFMTDDVEYDNVPMGKVYGPEGVRKVLSAGVTQEATDIEWRVLEQIEQGDTVMNERVDCFLVNDTWIEIPIAAVFKVRDGKICLWRDYFDLDTYRKQRAQ
jgi:limonene-1,2-epoxide hydrolase